ncbi:hypothetical protein BDZ91DRAFT_303138 [Kalaharituber pfeilii]|nr:hypothetical protein BDZ91DRAFT_303138 [Kalaharituber pfeilii]
MMRMKRLMKFGRGDEGVGSRNRAGNEGRDENGGIGGAVKGIRRLTVNAEGSEREEDQDPSRPSRLSSSLFLDLDTDSSSPPSWSAPSVGESTSTTTTATPRAGSATTSNANPINPATTINAPTTTVIRRKPLFSGNPLAIQASLSTIPVSTSNLSTPTTAASTAAGVAAPQVARPRPRKPIAVFEESPTPPSSPERSGRSQLAEARESPASPGDNEGEGTVTAQTTPQHNATAAEQGDKEKEDESGNDKTATGSDETGKRTRLPSWLETLHEDDNDEEDDDANVDGLAAPLFGGVMVEMRCCMMRLPSMGTGMRM